MAISQIESPDPRYLAATDILIGDMSDINYEFLLYDRPVILLANEWLQKNFPGIGIKTDLNSLADSIIKSIKNPDEYSGKRKYWLEKTMLNPDGKSAERVIDAIFEKSKIQNPYVILIHGDNEVLKTHIDDLFAVLIQKKIDADYVSHYDSKKYGDCDNLICISPNNMLLKDIKNSFNVHLDHGVKGPGTTEMDFLIEQYKERQYFPNVHLHVTEGEISFEKTRIILGPNSDRAVMAGYPKSDTLIKINNMENRLSVCREFGFNPKKLIISYAPAGKYSFPFKQGGSLDNHVLNELHVISKKIEANFLIKLKNKNKPLINRIFNKIKDIHIK